MVAEPVHNNYHYGVGGAGNTAKAHTTASQSVEPAHVLQTPREFRHHKFSTGIGGRGNIVMAQQATHYADADGGLARLLQEELRAPRTVLSERRHHTGIGGYANIHEPDTNDHDGRGRSLNSTKASRENSVAMGLQSGRDDSASRGSMADSMKDFLMGRRSRSSTPSH